MTAVQPPSTIAILTNCPYIGRTREVRHNHEVSQKVTKELQKELKKTKDELHLAKNVLINTQKKLAAIKRILGSKLGYVADVFAHTGDTFKDTHLEGSCVKDEPMQLVDYACACGPQSNSKFPDHPCKLPASAEDKLLKKQEVLRKQLYEGYTFSNSDDEETKEFFRLKKDYEKKLYANNIMEKEIAAMKERALKSQMQFLEDKHLIDFITSQQFKIKGNFKDGIEGKQENNGGVINENFEDQETEKYKKLWESSKTEKERLVHSIQNLSKKLEITRRKIIHSEKICSGNIVAFRNLADKIRNGVTMSKVIPQKLYSFGKYSMIEYRSEKRQLEAALEENEHLRNFLQKHILPKTEDENQLQKCLRSTAEKYRVALETIRDKSNDK